ncbi:MAG: hypothetical protein MK108_03180 [Mariniblastus sp.]|nr:hypothetical protein [Mariniblastus sp.]
MLPKNQGCHPLVWGVALAAVCLLSLGCGGDPKPAEPESTSPPTDKTALQGTDLPQQLVGIWLGDARIDQAQFEAHLATMSPEQQAEAKNIVANFLTTVMAMQYTPEGLFENEVEMSINGNSPIRDVSLGTYQVLAASGNELKIKVNERLADGSSAPGERIIRFSADRNQCEVAIPLGAEFAGVTTKLVFTRQEITSVAETPNPNSNSR